MYENYYSLENIAILYKFHTQESSEVAALKKQVKELEDRESKLKQLALKAKKEVADLKNKVSLNSNLPLARSFNPFMAVNTIWPHLHILF